MQRRRARSDPARSLSPQSWQSHRAPAVCLRMRAQNSARMASNTAEAHPALEPSRAQERPGPRALSACRQDRLRLRPRSRTRRIAGDEAAEVTAFEARSVHGPVALIDDLRHRPAAPSSRPARLTNAGGRARVSTTRLPVAAADGGARRRTRAPSPAAPSTTARARRRVERPRVGKGHEPVAQNLQRRERRVPVTRPRLRHARTQSRS